VRRRNIRPDVANIPVPITLIPIKQRPLNHCQRVERQRCIREKSFCFSRVGESQRHLLRVKRLHVQQRTDLGTCEPRALTNCWGKSRPCVSDRYRPGRLGIAPQAGRFWVGLFMGCAFGFVAHGSLLTRILFVTQGFAWGDAGYLFGQDGARGVFFAHVHLSNWPLAIVQYV